MKKFKKFLREQEEYRGPGTLYPYVMPPSGLFPRPRKPWTNPMMTPGWATNPYWSPGGAGEGDWRIPGLWFTDQYNGYDFRDLPPWLRFLWGLYYSHEALPYVGEAVDIQDLYELFRQWLQTLQLTPEQYEDFVQQLLRWLRDHNFPVPEFIPTTMHQMFYLRLPNGTYQLMRWNPQTNQYEPFGEPIETLPDGENVPPVYNHPDYVKPPFDPFGLFPDYKPIQLNPEGTPYIPNIPWSPTQTPYQWSQGSEIPEDPIISGMGG